MQSSNNKNALRNDYMASQHHRMNMVSYLLSSVKSLLICLYMLPHILTNHYVCTRIICRGCRICGLDGKY